MSFTSVSRSASSGISTSSSLGVWVMPIRTSTWCHSSHGRYGPFPGPWTLLPRGRLHGMSGADGAVGTERNVRWAATMAGYAGPVRLAHADSHARIGPAPGDGGAEHTPPPAPCGRTEREDLEASLLAPGATRAGGAGLRVQAEEPDAWRTCF